MSEVSLFGNVDPLVGKTLAGRWEILEFLGEGSMSGVYRARDQQTGTRVVIKMLHQHLVANNKNLKRFEQRAKGTLSLMHEKIGRVIDVQLTAEGNVFLVVEELRGESLEDVLAKSGHLSADQAVDVFIQVCEGLEYAHEQDVLHRDLKPSNIVILESGGLSQDVKLVDFGIAKLLSEESDDVKTSGYITRTREVFGSPMYMSPEQCMGKKLDGRSDVYSLGCVMYETLTGKPPFVGKNVLETAYKHMNEAPKPIAADRPGERALTRFESIIFKCLSKDPNDRYQSVSQLRTDLEALPTATEVDWMANAYALKKATKAKKREKAKRAPVVSFEVLVFAGASLLLAIVVGVWSFSFLGQENQDYPTFNNDMLWVVKGRPQPAEIPDFGSREEAAKMDVATIEKEKGSNCREYSTALWNLTRLYIQAGHWSDAALDMHKLIETTKKVGGPIDVPTAYAQLAYAYFMQTQLQDAEVAATNSLEEAERAGLNSTLVIQTPLNVLGDIHSQKGELDKATDDYEKLYNVIEPRKLLHPVDFSHAAARLGDVYRRQDKLDYAERYYRQALETVRNSSPRSDDPSLVKILYGLGLVLEKEGNYKESEEDFREALPLARKIFGERSAMAGACKKELTETLWKTNWFNAIMNRVTDK
jgi:serine/threonine protein kinase